MTFLRGPPPIQNIVLTLVLGTSNFEAQIGPFEVTPSFSRKHGHLLQILKNVDIQGMSTDSIMPFHNENSILVH